MTVPTSSRDSGGLRMMYGVGLTHWGDVGGSCARGTPVSPVRTRAAGCHLPPSVEHAHGRQAPPASSRAIQASNITRGACQRTPQGAARVRWGVPRDAAPRPGPFQEPRHRAGRPPKSRGGVGGFPKLNSAANTPRRGRARSVFAGVVCFPCVFSSFVRFFQNPCSVQKIIKKSINQKESRELNVVVR